MQTLYHFVFSLLIGCIWICVANAQTVEQIWPPDSAGGLADVVIWNENTFVAFGANDAILQSDDRGAHWEKVRWGNGEWNFIRAVKTRHGLFVLAQAAVQQRMLYPEGNDMRLMEYDPLLHILRPCFPPLPMHKTEYAWIEAMEDTLLYLAVEERGEASLMWSPDGAKSWKLIPLPERKSVTWGLSVFGRSTRELGCIMRDSLGLYALYITTDGGALWKICPDIKPEMVRHQDVTTRAGAAAVWTQDNSIVITSRIVPRYPELSHFFVSKDKGRTWQRRANRPYDPIAIRAIDSNRVCYTDFLRNVYLSEDGARSFRLIATGSVSSEHEGGYYLGGHFDDWSTGLHLDGRGNIAVCDRRGNLRISTDNGESWTDAMKNVLNLNDLRMFDELHGALEARDITNDKRHLYTTTDGGRSWNPVCDIDSAGFVALRHHSPTLSFALPSGWRDDSTAVYRSTDGGRTWTSAIKDQQRSGNFAFIATEADSAFIAVRTEWQIFLTTDAGASWIRTPRHGGGDLRWLGRSGLAWIVQPDGVYQSTLSLRHGYWNAQYKVLDHPSPGSYLPLNVHSDVEACLIVSKKLWRTRTSGETWESSPSYDGVAFTHWTTREGKGALFGYSQQGRVHDIWHDAHIHLTTDHWLNGKEIGVWYCGELAGSRLLTATNSGSTFYIFTDQRILRIGFDPTTNAVHDPPQAWDLEIETPSPHPVSAGAVMEIHVRTGERDYDTRMDVFDIRGAFVRALLPSSTRAGVHCFHWNTKGIRPGSYILRVGDGQRTRTRQVVIH